MQSTIPNGGAGRDTNNLAPRLGFTYTAGKNREWVVRGGAGVFYNKTILAFPAGRGDHLRNEDRLASSRRGYIFELTEDFIAQYGMDIVREILVFPDNLTLRFSTGTRLDSTQANLFNLGFDRAFGTHGALSANVTRSLTYHVPLMKDLNPVIGDGPRGAPDPRVRHGERRLDRRGRHRRAVLVHRPRPRMEVAVRRSAGTPSPTRSRRRRTWDRTR